MTFKYLEQWIKDKNRKSPQFAFTEGEERRMAYLIEEYFEARK